MELWSFQQKACQNVLDSWRSGSRRVVLVSPTGSGKTEMLSHLAHQAAHRGHPVVWVAHRDELVAQASVALERRIGSLRGITVTSVQTMLARSWRPPARLLVLDECFPAGTLVDGRPIEDIRVGDFVTGVLNGETVKKRVTYTWGRHYSGWMVRMRIGATVVECTPNHLIWVENAGGYVEAKNIVIGDLCRVWEPGSVHEKDVLPEVPIGSELTLHGQNKHSRSGVATDKWNAQAGGSRARIKNFESNGSRATISRRQWDGSDKSGASDCGCDGNGASPRRENRAQAQRGLSTSLQDRCRGPAEEDRNRSRRKQSLGADAKRARRQEGRSSAFARVDRIEGYQPSGAGGITVYDIEVEEAHNFFANGILVHNCHHHVADEWGKVAASYSYAAILGGTATPERSDGRPLGNLFDRMVVAATYPDLVEGGYLVPCRVFRPGEALSRGLATNPLEAYRKHGEEQKAFVFCPSVKLAREWAEAWTQAGIPSEAIDQATPLDVRRRSIARFFSGEIRALFNVYVLTEGVDIPDCGCVVLARNVGHQTPYLQMVGRALRRAPGKSYGILIDLPGCSFAHGLPTAHRDYSLEDGITRRKEKEEALRVCLQCGMTHTDEACPRCGFKPEPRKIARPTIYDMALQEVPNDWAPDKIQQAFALQGPPSVLRARYKKLFGDSPDMKEVPVELKRREWRKLVGQARARQYKIGWASHRFKAVFGHGVPLEWWREITNDR